MVQALNDVKSIICEDTAKEIIIKTLDQIRILENLQLQNDSNSKHCHCGTKLCSFCESDAEGADMLTFTACHDCYYSHIL